MSRQKKSRLKAGRVPTQDMAEPEVRDSHTSLSKLKPRQRSVYETSLEKKQQQQAQSKRKNRLKSDPAEVAARSRELLAQQDQDDAVKDDSTKDDSIKGENE
ncbi:MAG: hypothetical protein V7752_04840 [Halopseudomonas sp.]